MKRFSVPADFKKETIDRYVKLNQTYKDSRVLETYGNVTIGNLFGSGRSLSQLPSVDLPALKEFVKYSKSQGIAFDYSLNTSHMQNREFTKQGIGEIKSFLYDIYESGIRYLTVTLPSIMEIIISTGLDFSIKASAICSIDNPNIALAFKKMGADRIVVKELINRDFHVLRRIVKNFGDKIEIIVNTPCHMDCSFRMSHYNQQSSDSIEHTNATSFNYYEHKCMHRRYSELGNWLKTCWVRPEDLHYYTSIGINYFKLQGRQSIFKGGDIARVTETYFKGEYDGDLIDLVNCFAPLNSFKVEVDNKKLEGFLKPFYEKDYFCIRDCTDCDYCDVFARKCIKEKEAEEICELAKKFYEEYSGFNQLVNSVRVNTDTENPRKVENKHHDDESEFEF
jgi:collagenase-like PrtC family protease